MGISLKDLGNIATGAIQRDRELTRENLAIRHEELKANRDFLVAQKQKKYDKELENYYKEKEKFDTINQANEMYNKKAIDARTYAATILPLTNPNWKNLDDKTKEANINNFQGETIPYKLIGNEEEIQKQAATINAKINSVTADEIKNAKGDSFLINKILGDKAKAEKDLLQEVESKIKAVDSIKMSEKDVNQEYVGKEVNVSGSGLYSNIDKTSKRYTSFEDKNFTLSKDLAKLSFDYSDKNNNQTIAKVGKELNIANIKDYFKVDRDNNIIQFKEGGAEFAKTTYSAFKQYKDYLGTGNSTAELFVLYNGEANRLIKHYDKGNLDGTLANRIKEFGSPVINGAVLGPEGDFSNLLRSESNIVIVPTGNTIDFNNTLIGTNKIIDESKRKEVATIYANVLKDMATQNNQVNIQTLKEINNKLQNLEYGTAASMGNKTLTEVNNIFFGQLIDKNIITKEEALQNPVFNYSYQNSKEFKNTVDKLGTAKPENISTNSKTETPIPSITIDGQTVPLTEKNKKYFDSIGFDYSKLENSTANINVNKPIKKTGDGNVAEQVYGISQNIKNKIEPSELGDTTFTNLESVLKILPNTMTGQEIKDKYNINFPINLKSKYSPLR